MIRGIKAMFLGAAIAICLIAALLWIANR